MSQIQAAADTHGPVRLSRVLWLVWLPWLALLFGVAAFAAGAPHDIAVQLLGVSWLATGVGALFAAAMFKSGLANREADVLLERKVFGGFWSTTDLVRLVGAARDARVSIDPILRELASRHLALTVGTTVVFGIAAVAMLVFR